ncbi:MAG: ribonuclease P protein component [Candidatus Omnitrophota bacterium]
MLPRSQRLSVGQFGIVMEKGRVFHSTLFLIRVLKTGSGIKVAAVAPQKAAKKAVDRNKMRRKIYEAVVPPLSKYDGKSATGYHVIVFAKPAAAAAEFKDIVSDINTVFVKAGILK